jgi:hypothetical protein
VILDSAFFMMFVQRFAGLGYNDGEVETYSSGGHGRHDEAGKTRQVLS